MKIRPAHTADAAAANELLRQLGYPQDGTAATARRIQNWSDDSAGAVYVAEDEAGGELLGLIAVHICPFFQLSGSSGRIVALVVSDRLRGQGIGRRLVEAAESFATRHGCIRMEVTSRDQRVDAHAFYQGRGYVDQRGTASRFLRDLDVS
ncbi:GNAT family N-acetyltransferase [Kribbella sp. NPDC004875]|uniref:GNAT family N-acetyltransferase n=1 Tax=Kribbella sp. NPDC004875 TaxID=3364107 RepID=UPI003687465A